MIGIDIVEISRIKKNIENQRFLDRVYTKNEQQYIKSKGNPAQTAAGIFAAKEAAAKAIGTGFGTISPTSLEVQHEALGRPYILYGGKRINISISHCGEYAVANAAMEG